MRKLRCICTLLVAAAFFTPHTSTFAQDGKMGEDQQAMMEAMIKAGTPGEAHKLLQAMAGTWTTEGKVWMDPSQPPMEFQGKSEMKTILGGRYVQEDFQANFMGPFQGFGLTGYDNTKKMFVGTWVDNMTTSILTLTGTFDEATKTFTYTGETHDPIQGQKTMKMTHRLVDENTHVSEFYEPTPDGKLVKTMELIYKRS